MYKEITKCRVCNNLNLKEILDLGDQVLNGIFPKPYETIDKSPLKLVICSGNYPECCNLVQLKHTYDLNKMYGDNYGYKSSLNNSMIKHLHSLVEDLLVLQGPILQDGDRVIDIASNDGTLLQKYLDFSKKLELIGVDPTALKFSEGYVSGITAIPKFFGTPEVTNLLSGKKAKIISSLSMFYDLEDPVSFCEEIVKCLDVVHGVWVFEQSYLPSMIRTNSFDTVVQEHLEYYGLRQIHWILQKVGLSIHKVEFNDCNGGSFRVYANNGLSSRFQPMDLSEILKEEEIYSQSLTFTSFKNKIKEEKIKLINLLQDIKSQGLTVAGIGASTKGNCLLQYYQITPELLPVIGEINDFKFGKMTPGTNIPIRPEDEVLKSNPDYLLIMPWHFKDFMKMRFSEFVNQGGKIIFPLPTLTVISRNM